MRTTRIPGLAPRLLLVLAFQTALIILRLAGITQVSWWLVLSPVLYPAILLVLGLLVELAAVILQNKPHKHN